MQIAILGGAFDPIHRGHLVIAEAAFRQLGLERLFFVPSFISPAQDKDASHAPPEARLEMVQAAIRGHKGFEVSDAEIKRGGISYTVETVADFRKKFPLPDGIFFIIGSDWLARLGEWQDAGKLLSLCRFAVAARPGYSVSHLPDSAVLLPCTPPDVSSRDIRAAIRENRNVEAWAPEAVMGIIRRRHLYER